MKKQLQVLSTRNSKRFIKYLLAPWLLITILSTTAFAPWATPTNDLCSAAVPVSLGVSVSGTNVGATSTDDPDPYCGVAYHDSGWNSYSTYADNGVWYTVTGNGGQLIASTCGTATGFTPVISVYQGPCNNLTSLNCNLANCYSNGAYGTQVSWNSANGVVYHIMVSGYDRNSGNFSLVVNPACTAPTVPTLSASENAVCPGGSTRLSITSGNLNSATAWQWYSGSCGGTLIGTGTYIDVAPTSNTTYYVRGEGGCVSPGSCASISITVNPKPVVTVNQPTAVCAPATVNLNNTVTADVSGSSFSFFTDQAATSPVSNPSTVSTSGTYYVKATSGASCVSDVKSIVVTVNPKPVVTVNQPAAVCAPATVNLNNTVAADVSGSSFNFFTDQAATNAVSNPSAVSTSGTYYVRATSGAGCQSDSKAITVTVNPKPVVTVNQPAAVCFPATVNLTSTVTVDVSGSSFSFFTDQAATNAVSNPGGVSTSGTYYVKATSGAGCASDVKSIVVTINPLPVPTLSNTGPISDNNQTVTLNAGGGSTYKFSAGASQQSGASGSTATVTTPGGYQVTVTSAQGCTATASTLVTGANNASSCRNGIGVINVVASGTPVKYEWYRNSINSARLTENPAQVRGTSTSSLTLVNQQVTANYYVRVTDQNGSAVVYGPFKMTVDLSCNVYARIGIEEVELKITLVGNPVQGEQLRATVQGAAGKRLNVQLLDLSGKPLRAQQWQPAENSQPVDWNLSGQASGVYLLQATTEAGATSPAQRHSLKVIKP